jgi:E3 ubiquitin ligase SMURF1/2/E3 ubiquitin-protein ligase NEDD4
MLHKWIRVQFAGEPGVDAGGLEREWFTLIVAELFDPANGLFTCSSAESMGGAYHINPTSDRTNPEEHLELFALAGRVIGKAIMEQQAIAATLSLPLRKQILNLPITFSDLEFVDPVFYHNLKFLETFEDIESLSLDFTVSYPVVRRDEKTNCDPVVFDLKPGGSNVAVTNENRDEYLQLLLANRMLTSVKSHVEYLLGGLYEVIPPDILSIFDYQELELLLCGVPDIDVKDWSTYTEYMGGYNLLGRKHKVIQWFWAFVEGCDNEEKAHLLQFITGCSRVPAQGFKALVSNDGKLRKFNIQSINKKDSIYPRSHTCFNKLDLPMYDSQAELDAYMSCVTNGDVFGFTIE